MMATTKKSPAKKIVSKKTTVSKKAPAKKPTVKKPAATKKAPAKKPAAGKAAKAPSRSASHRRLSLELTELLPSLDEEGLSFLVRQAHVHLHNMEVDRLEAEAAELSSRADAVGSPARRGTGRKAGRDVTKDRSSPANFRVERSSSGASYHLISGGKWKMFTEGEMGALVKIAHGPGSAREAGKRLHRWFADERRDAFPDLEIGDERDPKLAELAEFLRARFAVKR